MKKIDELIMQFNEKNAPNNYKVERSKRTNYQLMKIGADGSTYLRAKLTLSKYGNMMFEYFKKKSTDATILKEFEELAHKLEKLVTIVKC